MPKSWELFDSCYRVKIESLHGKKKKAEKAARLGGFELKMPGILKFIELRQCSLKTCFMAKK